MKSLVVSIGQKEDGTPLEPIRVEASRIQPATYSPAKAIEEGKAIASALHRHLPGFVLLGLALGLFELTRHPNLQDMIAPGTLG